MGLKPFAVIVAVALTWGRIVIAMAHHEGSETGSGGASTTLLLISGGIVGLGVVAFAIFQIWGKKRNSGKKFHRRSRRKAE